MRVILEIISGPQRQKRVLLAGAKQATFGRTNWADYRFPADSLMSGKHFAVECDGQHCLVRDLNSTNGTYLNDERIIEAAVPSGAVIRAGQTKFRVTIEDADAAAQVRQTWTNDPPSSILVTAPEKPFLFVPSQLGENDGARPYDEALSDDDPIVRRNALLAAAWTGRKWVLEYARRISAPPQAEHWESLLLLAILGQPSDLERILVIGRTAELGPERLNILGAFGHPTVVKDLLIGMESKNPALAAAAGAAFTKITGVEVSSGKQAPVLAEEDTVSQEGGSPVIDEVTLPDPKLAFREWQRLKGHFQPGLRWCRGLDVSHGLPPGAADRLDLESRWEACLRGRFWGTWKTTSALDLEQLADKLSS
jgi:hypothetical protein